MGRVVGKRRDDPRRHVTKVVQRKGDRRIEVTIVDECAIVQFPDILAACTTELDDDAQCPWKNCDGYEHELISENTAGGHYEKGEYVRHYNPEYRVKGRDRNLIVIRPWTVKEWGAIAYHGASRQVNAEARAENLRRTYETLAEWYNDGYSYWVVECDFRGFNDSIGGILVSDEDELEEFKYEVASQIAHNMREAAFCVVGQYAKARYRRNRVEGRQTSAARLFGFADREAYLMWLSPSGSVAKKIEDMVGSVAAAEKEKDLKDLGEST